MTVDNFEVPNDPEGSPASRAVCRMSLALCAFTYKISTGNGSADNCTYLGPQSLEDVVHQAWRQLRLLRGLEQRNDTCHASRDTWRMGRHTGNVACSRIDLKHRSVDLAVGFNALGADKNNE